MSESESGLAQSLHMELARKNLLEFAHYAYPGFFENWHHGVIYTVLNEVAHFRESNVILEAPPRHGKTMAAGESLPAFVMAMRPGVRVLYTTYSQTQGEKVVRDLKALIQSPEYQRLFPWVRITGRNTTTEFELSNCSAFTMRGVGQGIGGQPANLLICDDLIRGRVDAESQTGRDKLWEWYVGEATARLEWPQAIVLMFTRWHFDDPIGRALSLPNAEKWRVLRFPAIMDEKRKPIYDPREDGEPLWIGRKATKEERRTLPRKELLARELEALYDQKMASPYTWESVYQQRPAPREGALFKNDWFRTYKARPESLALQCDEIMISVDATFKKSKNSDYVSMLVAGRQGAKIFVLDEVYERLDFPSTLSKLVSLKEKWPRASILVETKANGQAIVDSLRDHLPNILEFDPGRENKETRAQIAAQRFEAGQIWLPTEDNAPWIDDWKRDFVGFGSRPHDDRVDSLSQLCIRWQSSKSTKSHLKRILGVKDDDNTGNSRFKLSKLMMK